MNKHFRSIYADHLLQYIRMKQQFGFSYQTGAVILAQLDRLAAERNEKSIGITQGFALAWGQRRTHESERSRYDRIGHLIRFSCYLTDLGIDSYVPRSPSYPQNTCIPYIYSSVEIEALCEACDQLRLNELQPNSSLISMPALIRLLYGTGLRIGEALKLTDQDVNLAESYLRVKDSKNDQERLIPLSTSLVSVCKEYVAYRDRLPLEQPATCFFVKLNGRPCTSISVRSWFKRCLHQVGIPATARLHDLRHTFAVHSLATMAEAGVDLYVSLPILSRYLGHQSLESTNHYVRLTASSYPGLIQQIDMICLDVFPKTHRYEAH